MIPRCRIISCLKDCQMISKGCLHHIVRFYDLYSEIPLNKSIDVAREFPEVFPNDLPGIPQDEKLILVSTCHWINIPFQFLLI